MANMAQLVNVIAPIFTNDQGLFLQTIYYPLQMFASNSKGKALELFVDSPTYDNRRFGPVPFLDTSAAYNGDTLVLNVVNRNENSPITAEIEAEDRQFSGEASIAEVNGPDIKAENNFDSVKVKPASRSIGASGRKLSVTFAPHSYTMLKVKLA
jgi:alpha-N-arabinofuranosidase